MTGENGRSLDGIERSGLYPHPGEWIVTCCRCGRSTTTGNGDEFVFGVICDRADCEKVSEGIPSRLETAEMAIALPVQGGDGVSSCWSPDGKVIA